MSILAYRSEIKDLGCILRFQDHEGMTSQWLEYLICGCKDREAMGFMPSTFPSTCISHITLQFECVPQKVHVWALQPSVWVLNMFNFLSLHRRKEECIY